MIDPENQKERERYNSTGEQLDKDLKDAEAMAKTQEDRDSFSRLNELNQQFVALEATMMQEAGTTVSNHGYDCYDHMYLGRPRSRALDIHRSGKTYRQADAG